MKSFSKSDRQKAMVEARREIESRLGGSPLSLGLHNDPKKMGWLLKDQSRWLPLIPWGCYCYDANGKCPFLDFASSKDKQSSGFCWLLFRGDWMDGMSMLFDSLKECGYNDYETEEGVMATDGETQNAGT